MTDQRASTGPTTSRDAATSARPWVVVRGGAAGLAAGLGVGRFVFTPILPLMTAQAGLSPAAGATIATDNYLGYLAGSVAGILAPGLVRSATALRVALVTVAVSLALMPMTSGVAVWGVIRLAAGAASALIFVICAAAILDHVGGPSAGLVGWGFGGVGTGIALSGGVVLVVGSASGWRAAWASAALVSAMLAVAAWNLPPERASREQPKSVEPRGPVMTRTGLRFGAVLLSYTLEGLGYIIAGTFLVAAIDESAASRVGSGAWVLAGIAAVPSTVLWGWLAGRASRLVLLVSALGLQAVGVALPAVVGGAVSGLASAVLFGATFVGISSLCLAVGRRLGFPRAVAILTAGYSVGQIAGPLAVKPLLHDGYQQALLLGSGVIVVAAVAAAASRIRLPNRRSPRDRRAHRPPRAR